MILHSFHTPSVLSILHLRVSSSCFAGLSFVPTGLGSDTPALDPLKTPRLLYYSPVKFSVM